MSFFKSIAKFITKPLNILPGPLRSIAAPVVGFAVGGPIGAAAASGVKSYADTGSLKNALLSAGGSYAGSQIAGNVIGDKIGTLGGTLGQTAENAVGPAYNNLAGGLFGGNVGGAVGNFAGNALGSVAGTSLSSILGGSIGSDIAQNTFGDSQDRSLASSGPSPFSPTQEDQKQAPASITGLGSLTSDQESTNLANQGVYGGGNGPQESDYFLNLINRRLVDKTGQTSGMDQIKPIENSYLQQLGLGGYDNTNSLLEAISKWHQQAA